MPPKLSPPRTRSGRIFATPGPESRHTPAALKTGTTPVPSANLASQPRASKTTARGSNGHNGGSMHVTITSQRKSNPPLQQVLEDDSDVSESVNEEEEEEEEEEELVPGNTSITDPLLPIFGHSASASLNAPMLPSPNQSLWGRAPDKLERKSSARLLLLRLVFMLAINAYLFSTMRASITRHPGDFDKQSYPNHEHISHEHLHEVHRRRQVLLWTNVIAKFVSSSILADQIFHGALAWKKVLRYVFQSRAAVGLGTSLWEAVTRQSDQLLAPGCFVLGAETLLRFITTHLDQNPRRYLILTMWTFVLLQTLQKLMCKREGRMRGRAVSSHGFCVVMITVTLVLLPYCSELLTNTAHAGFEENT